MKITKTLVAILFSASIMVSCSESASDISAEDSSITSEELTSEELSTALKTVIINYPVTAVNDDDTTEEINSDEELEEVITRNKRPTIEFPFDITIDGEIITIENIRDLKELVKRPVRRRPPFKLVFPVTVINEDLSTTEIADSEAMKAYKDGLEEGIKPTLQFPISIEEKDGTIIEIADEEALEAYITEQKEEIKNDRANANRPPFKLVFPVTVINEDLSTTEIADSEVMKAYKDGLEEGVKPTLQFPISIEEKDGTIIEMADEDALATYIKEAREERKNNDRAEHKRPPFKIVFPVTVINEDETTTEITNQEEMKTYTESLEKGTRPTFKYPFSFEANDGTLITISSDEDLENFLKENKPTRKK